VPAGELQNNTRYYWRVRHQDNTGAWSAWSLATNFQTAPPHQPQTPTNVTPTPGATGQSRTPLLTSSAFGDSVTTHTHAASQWQMATSNDFSTSPPLVWDSGRRTANRISIAVPPTVLQYNTVYYWRVRHQDSQLIWSNWSAPTSFRTTPNSPPQTPTNVSPPNGTSNVAIPPLLRSSSFSDPVPGHTHLASQWQVAQSPGFAPLVWDSNPTGGNLLSIGVPAGVLRGNTVYYWRVRHEDNIGMWSSWSSPTWFRTVVQWNARVAGRVTDYTNGSGIANATVVVFHGGPTPAQVNTAPQGNYSASVQGDQVCTITVTTVGYITQRTARFVTAGTTATVSFSLLRQTVGIIAGRVTMTGTNSGIAGVTVAVAGGPSALTDVSGYYSIPSVAAGSGKTVTAGKPGYVSQQAAGISVTAGQTTIVNFSLVVTDSVTVRGTVRNAATQLAISNAHITVSPGNFEIYTNTTGFYSLVIPAGSGYMIRADASGFTPAAQWTPVLVTGNAYPYDFTLFREMAAPTAPTGLTASPGDQRIDLAWNANPENDIAGYNLYRADRGTSPINTTLITGTQYQDIGLTYGRTYTYWVRAKDQDNLQSPPSAQVQAAPIDGPPEPVSGLRAVFLGFGIVKLEWDSSPSSDARRYHLYWDSGAGTVNYGADVTGSPVTTTTWVSQPLTVGHPYRFGVRVEDWGGNLERNTNVIIIVTPVSQISGSAKVYISSPNPGKRLRGNQVCVYARPVPGFEAGLRAVHFEVYHNGAWRDMQTHAAVHSNPDTAEPYFILWDVVTSLPDGPYNIRAVGIDVNGIPDGSPTAIQVVVDNSTGMTPGSPPLFGASAGDGAGAPPLEIDIEEKLTSSSEHQARARAYRNVASRIVVGSDLKNQITSMTIPAGALDRDSKVRVTLLNDKRYRTSLDVKAMANPGVNRTIACAVDEFAEVVVESGQTQFAAPARMDIPYSDVNNDGWVDGYAIRESDLVPVLIDEKGNQTDLSFTPDTTRNRFTVLLPKAGTVGLIRKFAGIGGHVRIESAVPAPKPPEPLSTGHWLTPGPSPSTPSSGSPSRKRSGQMQRYDDLSTTAPFLWASIERTWGSFVWDGVRIGPYGTDQPAGPEFLLPGSSEFGLYFRLGKNGPLFRGEPGIVIEGEGELFVCVNSKADAVRDDESCTSYSILLYMDSLQDVMRQRGQVTRAAPAWLRVP